MTMQVPDNSRRPRLQDLGIRIGRFRPGSLNAITDVAGVAVGHETIVEGEGKLQVGKGPVRTGVTSILPHTGNLIERPVEAACSIFNGAGTSAGITLLEEFGQIETPILLTSTLSVGAVFDALARWVVKNQLSEHAGKPWFNPLVGETDDSFLNDVHGFHVQAEHVYTAIDSAREGLLPTEGCVGAGTGIRTCGFKSGIGTSSRLVGIEGVEYAIGALVQSNFYGSLRIDGIPVGQALGVEELFGNGGEGSLMAVIATDLPLDSRQLKRLATRGALGMGRAGAQGSHSSGDYFIAFSTTCRKGRNAESGLYECKRIAEEKNLSTAFEAAADVVEEAIINSILKAVTMSGRDNNTVEAIDIGKLENILTSEKG